MSLRLFFASVVIGVMSMTSANADVKIKRWNPEGLSQPDGYSQLVTVEGNGKLVVTTADIVHP